MRVSHLPTVIQPGRVFDLLAEGHLRVVPSTTPGEVFLAGTTTAVPTASALGALVGECARIAGAEAARSADDSHFLLHLPERATEWIFDRSLLWSFLAGAWGAQTASSGIAVPRRVNSNELLTIDAATPTWAVTLSGIAGANAPIRWLVVETDAAAENRSVAEGAPTSDSPGASVTRGLNRVVELCRASGSRGAAIQIRRQVPHVVAGDAGMMRLDAPAARVYWPLRALKALLDALAGAASGGRGAADGGEDVQLSALTTLLDAELGEHGLTRLLQSTPRSAVERRARHAIRTVTQLMREGGVAARVVADSAYRTGALYHHVSRIVAWGSREQRETLRRAFGERRWEQIHDHGVRDIARDASLAAGVRVSSVDALLPWGRVAAAAEAVVSDLVARAERAGQRPPAVVVDILDSYFREPRGERLKRAWRTLVSEDRLGGVLEEVFLSQLRRDLPRLPRDILVLAGVGETAATKKRLSAAFSRRGRGVLLEDIEAVEAAIDRGEYREWDQLIAARRRVAALYASPRARSKIRPE